MKGVKKGRRTVHRSVSAATAIPTEFMSVNSSELLNSLVVPTPSRSDNDERMASSAIRASMSCTRVYMWNDQGYGTLEHSYRIIVFFRISEL